MTKQPFPAIDLTQLQPASDGRQSDAGVSVSDFELAGAVVIPLVTRKGHPDEGTFALSLVELAQGRFSAHPRYLFLHRAKDGGWTAADKEDIEQELLARASRFADERIASVLGLIRAKLETLGDEAVREFETLALRALIGL